MQRNRFILALIFFASIVAWADSLSKARTANESQEPDAASYYKQGTALLTDEKFDEAIKAFAAAVKLKPDYADAYSQMGKAYSEIYEYKKAADAYLHTVKYQPTASAYADLGQAYANSSDYKKALEAYGEAIKIDPKSARLHYELGVIHAQRGKEQPAVAEYKTLQTLDPALAQDLYNFIFKPMVPLVDEGSVRLRVIAVDSHGVPIRGLTASDFSVTEDGASPIISMISGQQSPILYCLAIDTSGSVRPVFNSELVASKDFVDKLDTEDQTLLIRFVSSDKIETLQEFTADKRLLTRRLDLLYIEGGQSAVVDAVYLAAQRLASYKFPNRNVRRVLVLLSDGEDRQSYYAVETLLALLRRIDVQIFAISLSSDNSGQLNENPAQGSVNLLRTITAQTGGVTLFPKSFRELPAAVNAILELVRSEYTIDYKSPVAAEVNRYRSIDVHLVPNGQNMNSRVIARSGYNAPAK